MILIFAGAGASKATNPDEYPTTIEFYERIDPRVKSDGLFRNVEGYITHTKKGEEVIVDIEEILWSLKALTEFAEDLGDRESLIGWFLSDAKILKSNKKTYDLTPLVHAAPDIKEHITKTISDINSQVYSFYARLPTEEELSNAWLPLLQQVLDTGDRIEIFTTNYDQVIEEAIDLIGKKADLPMISTGRVNAVQPYLDLSVWEESTQNDYPKSKGGGLLTKLHGSIDWSRDEGKIFVGTPLFSGEHRRQVIIYPGYKGVVDQEPFKIFHEHFRRALSNSTILLFIGFSFRDPYINDILLSSTSDSASIITINPSGIRDGNPFPIENVKAINDGFNLNSVNKFLDDILILR